MSSKQWPNAPPPVVEALDRPITPEELLAYTEVPPPPKAVYNGINELLAQRLAWGEKYTEVTYQDLFTAAAKYVDKDKVYAQQMYNLPWPVILKKYTDASWKVTESSRQDMDGDLEKIVRFDIPV